MIGGFVRLFLLSYDYQLLFLTLSIYALNNLVQL